MRPDRRQHILEVAASITDLREFQGFTEQLNAQGELTGEIQGEINRRIAQLQRYGAGRR